MTTAMQTTLFIDAGNTRIKWGIWSPTEAAWASTGFALTESVRNAAVAGDTNVIDALTGVCKNAGVKRVLTANVAGHDVAAAIQRSAVAGGVIDVEFVAAREMCCGITNQYLVPSQLGSDRFAALVAAHNLNELNGCAKLVVMAGTATTIDVLNHDGCFLGGSIVPGLDLMRRALHVETAQLPDIERASSATDASGQAENSFPRDTNTAIVCGTEDALIGAVVSQLQRMHRNSANDVAASATVIVASGGALPTLLPRLNGVCAEHALGLRIAPYLVLDGLRTMAASISH
jgi:type III pantothenate kinase